MLYARFVAFVALFALLVVMGPLFAFANESEGYGSPSAPSISVPEPPNSVSCHMGPATDPPDATCATVDTWRTLSLSDLKGGRSAPWQNDPRLNPRGIFD